MQNRKTLLLGLTTAGLAALAYFLFSKSPASAEPPSLDESEFVDANDSAVDSERPTPSARKPEQVPSTELSIAATQAALPNPRPKPNDDIRLDDEKSVMAALRGLAFTDPDRSIDLARKADERFPNSDDAAERSWYVIRCLDRTGRHEEAWQEAKTMVDRFPGTSWTEDVRRHVLRYPNGPYLPKTTGTDQTPHPSPSAR